MKFLKSNQIPIPPNIDTEVYHRIACTLDTLNEEYGENRTLQDSGGYVLLICKGKLEDERELTQFLDEYGNCIVEYCDSFKGKDGVVYYEMLFLLSSDDAVMIYMDGTVFK